MLLLIGVKLYDEQATACGEYIIVFSRVYCC